VLKIREISLYEKTWLGVIAGRQHTRRPPLFSITLWNKNEAMLEEEQVHYS